MMRYEHTSCNGITTRMTLDRRHLTKLQRSMSSATGYLFVLYCITTISWSVVAEGNYHGTISHRLGGWNLPHLLGGSIETIENITTATPTPLKLEESLSQHSSLGHAIVGASAFHVVKRDGRRELLNATQVQAVLAIPFLSIATILTYGVFCLYFTRPARSNCIPRC
jgi:hypothetical protein